jgi:putative (di)nucleoside polyphosphate hydrolase
MTFDTFIPPLEYRLGVGAMLLNKNKKVFVGNRLKNMDKEWENAWQMPQGGIDRGEDVIEALMRELQEEIGTNQVSIISESKDWLSYDLPEEIIPKFWGGKFKGQKQKWFLMQLNGGDDLINIFTDHQEFKEWKWVELEVLPDLIVSFKKDLYYKILNEFVPIIKYL